MRIIYYTLVLLAVELISCKSSYKATNMAAPVAPPATTKTVLNWTGTYRGVLPCADCDGIQKTLYIDSNHNYTLSIKYLGKDDSVRSFSGSFRWNWEGNTITLEEDDELVSYFVVESALTQLDANGKKMIGTMAPNYILSKEKYSILRKYWKLTELNGRSIHSESGFGKEPHIIFRDEEDRFTGSAGCNNFSGTYQLSGINDISFSDVVSTMISCSSMDVEAGFLKALQVADNYHITDDVLELTKAGIVTLARFKTVYVKEEVWKN